MWFLACSGPGAMATIARNVAFTGQQAAVVGCLTAASLLLWVPFNRRIRYPAACLLLLSFHPAWTMSAAHGDCGNAMADRAAWVSLFAIAAVILQARYAVRLRRPRLERPGPTAA